MNQRSAVETQDLHRTWLPEDTEDTSNPSYYKTLPKGVEVYEVIEAVVNRDLGFTCNVSYSDLAHVIRYGLRLGKKNGTLQELKKMRWYLDTLIKREEALNEQEYKSNAAVSEETPGTIGAIRMQEYEGRN